jgi:hypothetical protein
MRQAPPVISIADFLRCIRERLDRAAAISKAAEACAQQGNPEKAVGIILDVKQLLYEINPFLSAARVLSNQFGERSS